MQDSNLRPSPSQSDELTTALIRDNTTKVLLQPKITKYLQ